ncbi:MAG: hypothetical protein A3I72_10075 [Candidatus Tectomicrobia bacterium RIFCSPLOWO2_02_FULL_70_19]|nr:MAG: hypothetical protein A3I72_10075 [Candidatus Tectomicrobia bacterium RIFCSPLOWO2_02_FULL_70_19]
MSAPTNSPTTAPTVAKAVAILSPLKMNGSELGIRTFWNTCHLEAFIDRMRSSMSWSIALRPTEVEITMGKNAISRLTSTLGKSPMPNQMTNSGAMAILGTVWEVTKMGISVRSIVFDQTTRMPAGTPSNALAIKPRTTSAPVIQACQRRYDQSSKRERTTALGGGKTMGCTRSHTTAASHAAIRTRRKTTG